MTIFGVSTLLHNHLMSLLLHTEVAGGGRGATTQKFHLHMPPYWETCFWTEHKRTARKPLATPLF